MKRIAVVLLIFIMIATGCGTGSTAPNDSLQIASDVDFGKDDYTKVIAANNKLGFNVLTELDSDEKENTFISPTSLLMALSMVYNGADGVTKDEIANVLQMEEIDAKTLNQANASLMTMLDKNADKIQLNNANSIWLNENFHFQDNFAQHNKDFFNAEIQEIDIYDSASPKLINNWVKETTNGKIDEMMEAPLDPDLVAVLINAIYFNGDWTYEFDENETKDRIFYLADETTKEVPLMKLDEEDLAYMENKHFQAVSLPYGDEEMSMKIFLPKENSSLSEFKNMLTYENWDTWNSAFQREEGTVLLPKFQLEYEIILNDTLKKLGMTTAFEKGANFSKMIQEPDPLWISKIKQKTYVDVNEEGTEAAAATSVEVVTESAVISDAFHMEVNRPFFIAITDDETDAIIFMGTILDPTR